MNNTLLALIIGISIGFVIGFGVALPIICCLRKRKKHIELEKSISRRAVTVPIHVNGVGSSTALADSNGAVESPRTSEWSHMALWLEGLRRKSVVSAFGIPKYSYKEIKKATSNFTTIIGHGAFGPVYKAETLNGEIVAVKVLDNNSKQGEKEFLTEVLLLGRLHHRNLVDLVGYTAEKGQHMLLYEYMSNGSLASHFNGENHEPLSLKVRFQIALDVARALEYLHHGAAPPVVHRDIKSSNILLDQFMRARVTDFGLSRPEMIKPRLSNVRGTFGYLDPEYISTNTYTKKSDVYSFGVLLFELITGRNPQQGLMDYVKLAAMDGEDKVAWEEIADSHLNGKYDVRKLNDIAALALRCVEDASRNRPSMRDIVQALSKLCKKKHRNHIKISLDAVEEASFEMDRSETEDFPSTKHSNKMRRLHSRQ
ncbi:hypothetical protein L6164_036478 [Bauhinia variegata]|uniref:Uncharacterized protein n=1 Tax=Bauhinia variegata TaxID=167791 RepID=A0ACB9KH57_BAUVA|nr:hypothetical protein L6164_036478 [Bauhinia variegata]